MILETIMIVLSILFTGAHIGYVIRDVFTDEFRDEMTDQVPDKCELVPDQEEETFTDEAVYGSDALHQKNEAFDERIEALKKDLEQPPGTLFPEDHSIVDKQYIQVPPEEYAK